MPDLVALALPGGPPFVDALLRIWDMGDAVFPVDLRLPAPERLLVLRAMAPARIIGPDGERHLEDARPVESGDALVVATSGSTGLPKGVVLTHAAIEASAAATTARIGVAPDDHWLACLPLAHIGGLSVVTRALASSTALTVLPTFDPAAVERAAQRGASLVSLVGTALQRIDPSFFRIIVLGGSRPPEDRPRNCVVTYGLTETGSGVVYDGEPLTGVDVRLDAQGEIHLRGPMLLRSYRDGTDPKVDGWLPTADLGRWLLDGRLHVEGRRGDLIVTGGENVWPERVESVLADMAGVAEVAISARDDVEWGQIVVAHVVPADASAAPTLDEVRGFVKDRLPAYCAPKDLVLCAGIPRTALGKIRRDVLRQGRGDA
jgi:o-succinylbenzoate---CoA ligase